MPGSSDNGSNGSGSSKSKGVDVAKAWRAPFDAVERPVSNASESWVQSNTFMDGLAIAWRLQRRMGVELRRGVGTWLGAWNLPSRGDVDRLSNQLANLERQLRDVRSELERSESRRSESNRSESDRSEPESLPLPKAVRRRPASRDRD
jgi:hypothetical protein